MAHVVRTLEAPGRFTAANPQLTAHLFGRFTVAVDGMVVDTNSSRRTRTVLAYLVAHRREHIPRDVLMDVFWPNVDPPAARNSLHVTLTGIRNALRDCSAQPILQRTFDSYGIADSVEAWVDVEEFEQRCRAGQKAERERDLTGAVASYEMANQLYGGEFLANDPYAEWAAPIRDRLRLLALDVQSRLVELYAQRGDHAAALQLGRWILASDPCNERVHRRLMSCYATTGQGHLALAQYHRCADALWEAFRVRPAPETGAVYGRLRSHSAPLRGGG